MNLDAFLKEVPDLPKTERFQRLDARWRYYLGCQYEDRPLDACGYRKGMPGVIGSQTCSPSWTQRDPGAVWNLNAEAVEELTNWTLAGDAWCGLRMPDDPKADDFLNAAATQATMPDVATEARNIGGATGSVAVSAALRNGEYVLQALNPRDTWALEWADEDAHIPAVVAHVYQEESPFAKPGQEPVWVVRIWTTIDETTRRRIRNKNPITGLFGDGWRWEVVSEVKHGLGFCPVVWCPQGAAIGSHEGTPDVTGGEETIDDANYLLAAASATTKRNADDTVVIREDPSLNTGKVRKGGFNVIFARGGADYLTQAGESARICLEVARERGAQYLRRAHVVIPDASEMGAATSGEALRRRFQPMTRATDSLRRKYARYLIVPLCKMMLRMARIVAARGERVMLPPKVEDVHGKPKITPREPGKSEFVELVWPDPFQPTAADTSAFIAAASTATGAKQILSRRTAVATLGQMGITIGSVDLELARIEEDEDASADRQAKALGLEQTPPGAAGPIGDGEREPSDDDEKEEVEAAE